MLGDKKFDVDKDDSIIIDNVRYNGYIHSEDDKQTYKSILLTSNTHRRGHSTHNPIIGNKGYKYINIIAPLVSTYKKSGKKGAEYEIEGIRDSWNYLINWLWNIILWNRVRQLHRVNRRLAKSECGKIGEGSFTELIGGLPIWNVGVFSKINRSREPNCHLSIIQSVSVENNQQVQVIKFLTTPLPPSSRSQIITRGNSIAKTLHLKVFTQKRRQHREYLSFLWNEISREDVFDLQRLFGLRPYEEDEEVW
ncbi:hypothetical protein P5V15_007200 [Pogonomyrmex californicus]